jgi:hypothetical protein
MVSRLCIFRPMQHAYEDLALYRLKPGGRVALLLRRSIAAPEIYPPTGGRDPAQLVEPWIEHCMAIGTLGSIRVTTRIDGR